MLDAADKSCYISSMPVGILTLHLTLPGCASLKEKRSIIKPILSRLHREFNISVSEIGLQDNWRKTVLACAILCTDTGYAQSALQSVLRFFEHTWRDLQIDEFHIEII